MTIPANDARRSYIGNGVTTTFAAPPIIVASELTVQLMNTATGALTAQVLNTDYSVAFASTWQDNGAGQQVRTDSGVTFLAGAPAGTFTILIDRIPALTQTLSIPDGSAFPSRSVEDALDRVTMTVQAFRQFMNRALVLSDGETFTTFGSKAARAGALVGFDATTGALSLVTGGATNHFLFGTGAPAAGLGINGDLYFDTVSCNVYGKTVAGWTLQGNLKGSTGAQGAVGATGSVAALGDGSLAVPVLPFTLEPTSGWRRAGAGDMRAVILGADVLKILVAGISVIGTIVSTGAATIGGAASIAGNATVTGDVNASGSLSVGIASPAQITGDQADYAIPDDGIVRFDFDAARAISGFVAPAVARLVTCVNLSAFAVTFNHNVTSTAANRFALPGGADYVLPALGVAQFFYDLTSARWRMIDNHKTASAADIWGSASPNLVTPAALASAYAVVDLGTAASGGTTLIDGSAGINFKQITGAGNFTLGAPSNLIPGRAYWLRITQGATARTITFNNAWLFAAKTKPSLTSTAAAIDDLFFTALTAASASAALVKNVG